MSKQDLSKMTGRQLLEFLTFQPGEYAQTLMTAFVSIGEDLFPMLEECQRTGKRIAILDSMTDVNDPPITVFME